VSRRFFFQAEDGIRDFHVTGVQTCALPIFASGAIKAANPAHIIWQLRTDRRYGRGLPSSRMNADSFAAAADALYDEGFGLCLRWTRQDTIANFEQIVLDHIGAVIDEDPSDGTIR